MRGCLMTSSDRLVKLYAFSMALQIGKFILSESGNRLCAWRTFAPGCLALVADVLLHEAVTNASVEAAMPWGT